MMTNEQFAAYLRQLKKRLFASAELIDDELSLYPESFKRSRDKFMGFPVKTHAIILEDLFGVLFDIDNDINCCLSSTGSNKIHND